MFAHMLVWDGDSGWEADRMTRWEFERGCERKSEDVSKLSEIDIPMLLTGHSTEAGDMLCLQTIADTRHAAIIMDVPDIPRDIMKGDVLGTPARTGTDLRARSMEIVVLPDAPQKLTAEKALHDVRRETGRKRKKEGMQIALRVTTNGDLVLPFVRKEIAGGHPPMDSVPRVISSIDSAKESAARLPQDDVQLQSVNGLNLPQRTSRKNLPNPNRTSHSQP